MEPKREINPVRLNTLKDHPREFDFFSEPTEEEIAELASDMEKRGQQEPIHICPDGTILRGHRRVRAARSLCWTTIEAIVREDLPDPLHPDAVDELIRDNVIRQQMDDLTLARCYRELKANAGEWHDTQSGDVRDHLAQRLGCNRSGRTLDRLERLLDLPRDVQDMISSRVLTKQHGEKILRLDQREQDRLFEGLRANENIKDVLEDYGVIHRGSNAPLDKIAEAILRTLRKHLDCLSRDITKLDKVNLRGCDTLVLLDRVADFFDKWTLRKQQLREQVEREWGLDVE